MNGYKLWLPVLFAGLFVLQPATAHESIKEHLHFLNEALEVTKDQGEIYIQMGRDHMEVKNFDQAMDDFNHALAIDAEEYYQARFYLVESLLLSNKLEMAEKEARIYIDTVKTFNQTIRGNGFLLLADVLSAEKKFHAANDYYQQAFALLKSVSPDTYLRYAESLVQDQQHEAAVNLLRQGLEKLDHAVVLQSRLSELESLKKSTGSKSLGNP